MISCVLFLFLFLLFLNLTSVAALVIELHILTKHFVRTHCVHLLHLL